VGRGQPPAHSSGAAQLDSSGAHRGGAQRAGRALSHRSPRPDLHGLHVAEALGSLERRLAEMEAGAGVACAPRRLNVIVGRGRHSSGAEASIPRAVESFLTQRGNNFAPGRAGCLVVRVKHR
jgi:DNA-nicking Smr family endonuclease